MAASKSQKIQAEIDKVKAKISEQQAMSISLAELPLVLQQLREGTSGQSVQKSEPAEKEENEI